MSIEIAQLKILLVGSNILTEDQFNEAQKRAEVDNVPVDEFLISQGLIHDSQLGQLVANFLEVSYVDLTKQKIVDEVLHLIPEVVARSRGVIAFSKTDEEVNVAMVNPMDLEMGHFISKKIGLPVHTFYATPSDMNRALLRYQSGVSDALKNILLSLEKASITKSEKEQGIIDLVDTMLQYAQLNGVSDIHFDPVDGGALLRYRIDGILHDILKINAEFAELIVSRIKILSKMRTDEHRSAQDGKLSFATADYGLAGKKTIKKKIDVRVSVMPTVHGENLVMRILSSDNRSLTLDDLGFSANDAQTVRDAIKNPVGMILVTGPTGSGKTTTLYGVLKILNKREVNIATIEDPIEYSIEGITQIQVNTKTNLTFANGLRAIVRQDPNIIMVGEIRDHETADIAVNSAMTGHLVLSTLHANNSATTLPRLLDMGIEPFLVASTVNIIVAQRLVRMVCENCRVSYKLTKEDKKALETQPKVLEVALQRSKNNLDSVRLYRGDGCKVCEQTGYVGRVGIFEILKMSSEIKEAILKRLSSDEITKIAVAQGMTTMLADGVDKAWQGITTIQEVLRVASVE